jgi:type II secretory pathway pseudopilin PulG
MRATRLTSSAGFTFIAAMFLIVIMGIMLEAASQSWQTIMKREKEEELLFRGSQIRNAIERWRKPAPGRQVMPINDLKDLTEDPHSTQKVRYLRRVYKDPITNEDFTVIRDPALGIIGVASTSEAPPYKVDNFPKELKDFALKSHYREWQFVYKPGARTAATTTSAPGSITAPGMTSTPTAPGMTSTPTTPGMSSTPGTPDSSNPQPAVH